MVLTVNLLSESDPAKNRTWDLRFRKTQSLGIVGETTSRIEPVSVKKSTPPPQRRHDDADRFWSRVQKTDSCWPWIAARDQKGYGALCWGGRVRGAHRVAWELAHGPILDGLHVLHRCDFPACVRPDHLFLGTHRDNMRDRDAKGRRVNVRGEQHPGARLTDAQVAEVRAKRAAGATTVGLAAEYGVGQKNISDICLGKRRVERTLLPDIPTPPPSQSEASR